MQAWEQFLALQEQELGAETVNNWLRSLRIRDYDAANLYLEARDSFQVSWFEEHMRAKVLLELLNNNKRPIRVHLSISEMAPRAERKKLPPPTPPPKPDFVPVFETLDPSCTFQNLVVSESNLLAHKILCEVAGIRFDQKTCSHSEAQLAVFNPVYVYGPGGTGKTHFLMATARELRIQGYKVIYTRAETFTDHVVQAIRAGEMSAFRHAYRTCDVLILDDVHIFSRKSSTQEEFFHTFNTLHMDGKQIILSANCPPQELQSVEPRLISRFEWGIVMPLEPMKPEEMLLILRKKCAAIQFPIPHNVEEFLCTTFTSSPRALCGALEALALRSHLNRTLAPLKLCETRAQDLLVDLIEDEDRSVLKPDKIIQAVAETYGIRIGDILGKSQTREFVTPRQLAMYLCRHHLKMSFTKIGDLFKRDHSTVMSGIKRVQNELTSTESNLLVDLTAVQKKLVP